MKLQHLSQKLSICLFILSVSLVRISVAQDPFPDEAPVYAQDVVSRIDIALPADSLAVILAPGNEESDYHFHATMVFNNGTLRDTLENVGFRLRGNTSRYAMKKSFKVSLNTYVPGRTWYGVEKLNLNGEHNDPTVMRSRISWDLLRKIGVPAPRASHVRLYINGAYYGLYANVEHIDEEFVKTRFGNKDGNLYKCLWPADLVYLGDDPDLYKLTNGDRRVYELNTNEDTDDYSDLAHFIDILNNTPIDDLPCALEPVFNINSFLRAMAFDILSGDWDGPLYNKNNFYLYHNLSTGQFEYIPYDLDNTFGIDWFGIDWAGRDIYQWGFAGEPRPLYWRILQVPEYYDRFSYYMKEIVATAYRESSLFPEIDSIKALITPAVAEDPYYPLDYGFSLEDFNHSFSQALPYFHTPIGLKSFIANRRSATLNQLDVHDILPIIDQVTQNTPTAAQEITIQASAEDDQGIATIKVCYQVNGTGNPLCIPMYDDGAHHDGDAGDGRYGVILPPLGTTALLTYTIQATDLNGNLAVAPACGMRELYVGSAVAPLAINEFMASNDTTVTDEAGEYEDWVEIYNYGDTAVYLGDLYLSDNPDNPDKWQFPEMWIAAGQYLLIWADDDENQGPLHTSWKLSADGEYVGIFDSDTNGNTLIDGLAFGPQETDQAYGRLPDGTGPFQNVKATPGGPNEALTAVATPGDLVSEVRIYPNPASGIFFLEADNPPPLPVQIILTDITGRNVLELPLQHEMKFDIRDLPEGMYLVCLRSDTHTRVLGKVVKE